MGGYYIAFIKTTYYPPTPLFQLALKWPAHGRIIRTLRYMYITTKLGSLDYMSNSEPHPKLTFVGLGKMLVRLVQLKLKVVLAHDQAWVRLGEDTPCSEHAHNPHFMLFFLLVILLIIFSPLFPAVYTCKQTDWPA